MTEKNIDRCIAAALFAAFAVLYLALPTRDLYWDGAGFALAVDHPRWFPGLLPNHPLYIGLGRAIHSLARHILPGVTGLSVLQALNAVFGAISVALFYLISTDVISERLNSALLAGFFGLCATWWKFATDASAYILPVLVMLLTVRYLLPTRSPRPALVALLHTCAMLFHELAVLFAAPAMIGLCLQCHGDRRRGARCVMAYVASAFALSSAGYFGCFHAATGKAGIPDYVRWITYHTPDSNFSFDVTHNVWLTIRGTVRLLLGGRPGAFHSATAGHLAAAIGLSLAGMIVLRWRAPAGTFTGYAGTLPILWSWILAYVAFLFFWLPQNTFYRLFYLPPLILVAGVPLSRRARTKAMYAVVALLGAWNYAFFIQPHSELERNAAARSGLAMRSLWKRGTWLYMGSFDPDNWMVLCFNPQVSFKTLDRSKLADTSAELQSLNRAGAEPWIDQSGIDLLQSDPAGKQWLAEHTRTGFKHDYSDPTHRICFDRLFP